MAPSGAPREYLLFVAAGAVATTAHFALMTLLVEAASAPPVPASCAGALVGALVSYVLNYRFTFRSTERHVVALPKFLGIAAAAFVLNAVILAMLLRILPVHYLVSQGVTTLIVMAFTYTAGRAWAFR